MNRYFLSKEKEIDREEFEELDFDPLEVKPIHKKELVVFFLICTSDSMSGKKIGTLNATMEEFLPELRGLGGATTDIKLAIMQFSDGCRWVTPKPMSVDDYQYWQRLRGSGGSDLGAAFRELNKKLSRKEFLNSPSSSYAPVIFLLTDSYATDDAIGGLEELQHNKWYKCAMKIALGIGLNYDEEILKKFTGNPELVVTAKTSNQLAKLVKTIAVTSSQIGSKSMILANEDNKKLSEKDVLGKKEKELLKIIKHDKDFNKQEGFDMGITLSKERELNREEFEEIDFDPLEVKPISKKNLVVFFLVDTSGSMSGKKIGTLNTTMEELLPELRGLGGSTTDIKLAVMTFSDGCEWITREPMSVDDYQYWTRLKAEGLTDLGEAFRELSKKLSRKEFLNSPSLSYAPVIFLLTDGYATDDVIGGLEQLQHNNWYKYGLKVALGIGEKFDEELLKKFTGNPELVVTAKTSNQLAKLVKTIAVTSSQIGSRSMTLTNGEGEELSEEDVLGTKEQELADTIKDTIKNDEDFVEDFDVEDGWEDEF